MSADIIGIAGRRAAKAGAGGRIVIYPRAAAVEVRLEPPSSRPGVRGGSFTAFDQARRHALAMQMLDRRPIAIVWGDQGPAGGAAA